MRLSLFAGILCAAGCGHIVPVPSDAPPPWPAPDAPVVVRAAPQPPAPEPSGKPVVPPLKRDVPPPPATPNTPQ